MAQLAAAKKKAEALRGQIDQWNREALKQGIEALKKALSADRERLGKLGLEQSSLEEYTEAEIDEYRGRSAEARRPGRRHQERLRGGQAALSAGGRGYAHWRPSVMRLILEGQPRPAGFSPPEWNTLRDGLLDRSAEH